jgi:hypothetical protein
MRGSNDAYLAAWNFFLRMNTNDYFRLRWATSDTNVAIQASAATAFSPAVPSVILTVAANIGE